MEVFHLGCNENKYSGEDLNKIEATYIEEKQKMNSLKIKLQIC